MDLPAGLGEFSRDLAARLVLLDEPGPEVKRLRERFGFTQEALAPLLDLTRESLSRIESGHMTPTRAFIQRYTRLMTLAKGARDHAAYMEARDAAPDPRHLAHLATYLRVEPKIAEEVAAAAMASYERKKQETLAGLRPLPTKSARPARTQGDTS